MLMRLSMLRFPLLLLFAVLMGGCTGIPAGIKPVQSFELQRYLGKWYEVARLDHSFERGLNRVSAQYSLREDGGVKVVNRGWDVEKKQWKQAVGKAYFVRNGEEGYLKVSFFGPFYGAYVIFSLDANYQYSFIAGPNRDYLWLLSRTPVVSASVMQRFKQQAGALGFDVTKLIVVTQH